MSPLLAFYGSPPWERAVSALGALSLPGALALVVAGVALSLRARGRGAEPPSRPAFAALSFAVITLSLAPLADAWTRPRTHGAFIAGLVPYSDAADYLQGAEGLLRRGALDAWNSRRPLNAALLAVRLSLSGGGLHGALLLQSLLLALASLFAARAVSRDHGLGAALTLCGATLIFGGIFAPTTMSECLGLTLGALATAILWRDLRAPRAASLFAGVFALSLAMGARSGPFVVMPLVLLWAARGRLLRWDLRGLAAALAGVVAGAGFNGALLRVLHGEGSGAQSNFSYTLYGLSVGGRGWEQAWVDLPQIASMPEREGAALVYARALANAREHPGQLALGLLRNVQALAFGWTEMLSGGALDHRPVAQWAVALGLAVAVAYGVARLGLARRDDPAFWLLLAACLGVLGSVPVIYMDGRERVFAAAFPLGVAAVAYALSPRRAGLAPLDAGWLAPSLTVAAMACAALLAGSFGTPDARVATPTSCGTGRAWVDVDLRGAPARVDLRNLPGVAPAVDAAAFRRGIGHDPNLGDNGLARPLGTLTAGDHLHAAWDRASSRLVYVVARAPVPPRFAGCASVVGEGPRRLYRVTR